MKYMKAKAEVVLFDNSDVITTSGCQTSVSMSGDEIDNCQGLASESGLACGELWQSW